MKSAAGICRPRGARDMCSIERRRRIGAMANQSNVRGAMFV
jgi:hypothetical protein